MPIVFLVVSGLASGLMIGTGLGALFTLLDIIPRLVQMTHTYKYIRLLELSIIYGSAVFSATNYIDIKLNLNSAALVVLGSFLGIYIGLIAAALAELINVIPIMLRRSALTQYVVVILILLMTGKVIGSLIYWLFLK